jgi:protein CpxP
MRRLVVTVALASLMMAGTAHAQFAAIGSAVGSVGHAAGDAVQGGVNAVEKGTGAVTGAFTGAPDAKARIEASGYTNVTDLSKDSYGVWHARALKLGMPVTVSLDTLGSVKTD